MHIMGVGAGRWGMGGVLWPSEFLKSGDVMGAMGGASLRYSLKDHNCHSSFLPLSFGSVFSVVMVEVMKEYWFGVIGEVVSSLMARGM
jgi:hypothetical protein